MLLRKILPIIVTIGVIGIAMFFVLHKPATKPAKTAVTPANDTGFVVLKEYYSTGKIKVETEAKGNIRQGMTKNYRPDGLLMSEIPYVNNQKEGMSKDYYENGKLRYEIPFVKGLKQGESKWHYETGEVYRTTPYEKDVINGSQKIYTKEGKLVAEIPYKQGARIPGLKEYGPEGKLLSTPTLVIQESNNQDGRFSLRVHLSDNSQNANYYYCESLNWDLFPKSLKTIAVDQNGTAHLIFDGPKSSVSLSSIYIVASKKTGMGNELLLSKKYTLK